MPVNRSNLIAYSVMILIIIILLAVIYFRKPDVTIQSDRERVLQDSIAVLQTKIDSSHARQDRLQRSFDSLVAIDPIVISKTRDKIKFIFSTATPDELDSIIRTTWKTKSRYR
jgi:hypothetical protein